MCVPPRRIMVLSSIEGGVEWGFDERAFTRSSSIFRGVGDLSSVPEKSVDGSKE